MYLLIEDSLVIQLVHTNGAGSMNDRIVRHDDAGMSDVTFIILKECQVAW